MLAAHVGPARGLSRRGDPRSSRSSAGTGRDTFGWPGISPGASRWAMRSLAGARRDGRHAVRRWPRDGLTAAGIVAVRDAGDLGALLEDAALRRRQPAAGGRTGPGDRRCGRDPRRAGPAAVAASCWRSSACWSCWRPCHRVGGVRRIPGGGPVAVARGRARNVV